MESKESYEFEAENIQDDFEEDILYEPVSREETRRGYLEDSAGGGYIFGGSSRERKRSTRGYEANQLRAEDLSPHELGRFGEDIAARFLAQRGLEVIERNWTCPCGEADIICEDDGTHVLVEVKTRLASSNESPEPELAVTADKRKRYRRIAECFIDAYGVDTVRFDVVAINIRPGKSPSVRYFKSAFDGDE